MIPVEDLPEGTIVWQVRLGGADYGNAIDFTELLPFRGDPAEVGETVGRQIAETLRDIVGYDHLAAIREEAAAAGIAL